MLIYKDAYKIFYLSRKTPKSACYMIAVTLRLSSTTASLLCEFSTFRWFSTMCPYTSIYVLAAIYKSKGG